VSGRSRSMAIRELVRTGSLRYVRIRFEGTRTCGGSSSPTTGKAPAEERLSARDGDAPYTLADAGCINPWTRRRSPVRGREGGRVSVDLGPHHLAVHGVMRYVLKLRERPSPGSHRHRLPPPRGGKMGERQSGISSFLHRPVDYLSGVANNISYLRAWTCRHQSSERAQCIRCSSANCSV